MGEGDTDHVASLGTAAIKEFQLADSNASGKLHYNDETMAC
jgi:hypothetical protein